MNYIITTKAGGCTYYVQKKYLTGYLLNGLFNNAVVLKTRVMAVKVMKGVCYKFPQNTFSINEIGINNKNNNLNVASEIEKKIREQQDNQ